MVAPILALTVDLTQSRVTQEGSFNRGIRQINLWEAQPTVDSTIPWAIGPRLCKKDSQGITCE